LAAIPTTVARGSTATQFATNELKIDVSSRAYASYASLTPLTAILAKLASEDAFNFRVDIIEKHDMPVAVTSDGLVAAAGTTVTVGSGYQALVEGTLLSNPLRGDIARVTTTPTTSSVTVVRDYGGTTGVIWQPGDKLFLLPPAIAEDDDAYTASASALNSNVYNLTQLVRMNMNITRLTDEMQLNHNETTRSMLQSQKYREFRVRKELNKWLGGRSTQAASTPANDTIRTSGGVKEYLTDGTNYKDFDGSLTESSWDDYLNSYFTENYDTNNIMCFIGPKAKGKILNWGKARGRVDLDKDNSNKYGFKIDTYDYDGQLVSLVRCPLFNQVPTVSGWGFMLDMDRLMMKVLVPDALHEDIRGIESEQIIDMYRGSDSLLLANENKHGWFIGGN